jgi:acyl transferase domain-containing protein
VLLELGRCPAAPAGGPSPLVLSVLDGERPEQRALLQALARLHTMGATVDWAGLLRREPSPPAVPLPTYAFQRERYWLYDAGPATSNGARRKEDPGTDDIYAMERETVVET